MSETIFKKRFTNLKWAFSQLENTLLNTDAPEIEKENLVLFFDVTFDLAQRTLTDYLQLSGCTISSTIDLFDRGIDSGLIDNKQVWLKALDNTISSPEQLHEKQKASTDLTIKDEFYPAIKRFIIALEGKII
jgi:hypothetical protein